MPVSPEVKAVLLDFDDTCVKTIEPIWRLHKFIAATYYNKKLSDEELHTHWGKPLHELVQHLYDTDDHKIAFQNIYKHKDDAEYFKEFFEKVPELLEKIAGQKKLALITAHVREFLEIEFKYLNFNPDTFDYIQTSDETPHHKPDARVFEPAIGWLKTLAIQPAEALYVGDSFKDHEAAVNAGMQFVGVTTGLTSAADLRLDS
jgi:HAD superfamily hydrolase (TIGR01549 family)